MYKKEAKMPNKHERTKLTPERIGEIAFFLIQKEIDFSLRFDVAEARSRIKNAATLLKLPYSEVRAFAEEVLTANFNKMLDDLCK